MTNQPTEQQLQGTLQVTLRNSQSGQAIDDIEVRRKFQQFGDVKAVKPVGDRIELRSFCPGCQDIFSDMFISSRYVEFYDTRVRGNLFLSTFPFSNISFYLDVR